MADAFGADLPNFIQRMPVVIADHSQDGKYISLDTVNAKVNEINAQYYLAEVFHNILPNEPFVKNLARYLLGRLGFVAVYVKTEKNENPVINFSIHHSSICITIHSRVLTMIDSIRFPEELIQVNFKNDNFVMDEREEKKNAATIPESVTPQSLEDGAINSTEAGISTKQAIYFSLIMQLEEAISKKYTVVFPLHRLLNWPTASNIRTSNDFIVR